MADGSNSGSSTAPRFRRSLRGIIYEVTPQDAENVAIYFVHCAVTGLTKIGLTSHEPIGRLSQLQVGCPTRLRLIAAAWGGMNEEKAIHRRLRKLGLHRHGEWFAVSEEDAIGIARELEEHSGRPWVGRLSAASALPAGSM